MAGSKARTMKKLILLFSVFAAPTFAYADINDWLKKHNPDELAYFAAVSSTCPISEKEMQEMVEGVFIRSRIRPLDKWTAGEVMLHIDLQCIGDSDFQSYIVNVELEKPSVTADGTVLTTSLAGNPYGAFGRGDASSIKNEIKDSVERALTDYIKANFVSE
jgi:hypothetical protein